MRAETGTIEVRDGEIERAIKSLRKWTQLSGLIREVRIREGYLTRSQRRKIKDRLATRRARKRISREEEYLRRKDRRGVKR